MVQDVYYTCREYDCICYDSKDCCFYGTVKNCNTNIYKLDKCFKEVGCITLRSCNTKCQTIVGISINCGNNTIVIAFNSCIVEVRKNCGECMCIPSPMNCYITGVLCVYPGYVVTFYKDKKYYVTIIDQCGQIVLTNEVEEGIIIQDMLFNPIDENSSLSFMDCLVLRNLTEICVTHQPVSDSIIGYNIAPCNFDLCNKSCCNPCEGCDCLDPCGNVLQSIALIESAIANILNCEGAKLDKVIEVCEDVDKILCVNKSVTSTIVKVTHLEHVLVAKLEALENYCNLCGEKSKCDNCRCHDEKICIDDDNTCTCDVD